MKLKYDLHKLSRNLYSRSIFGSFFDSFDLLRSSTYYIQCTMYNSYVLRT